MHVETIRFDEVFDVVERSGTFSFKTGGRPEYGVRLQNHAIARQGATYAVAFAERGNWATVMGWRDLASGDVVLARPTMSGGFGFYVMSDLIIYGWLFITGTLLVAGGVVLALLALVLPVAGMALLLMRHNRAVKDVLFAVRA
jgi:hypothetical protein